MARISPTMMSHGVAPGIAQAAASITSGLLERRRADQAAERFRMSHDQQQQQFETNRSMQATQLAMSLADKSAGPQPGMPAGVGGMRRGATGGIEDPDAGRWYKPASVNPNELERLTAPFNIPGSSLATGAALTADLMNHTMGMASAYNAAAQGVEGAKTFQQLLRDAPPEVRHDPGLLQRYLREQSPAVFQRIDARGQAEALARQAAFSQYETDSAAWRTRWMESYNSAAKQYGGMMVPFLDPTAQQALGVVKVLAPPAAETEAAPAAASEAPAAQVAPAADEVTAAPAAAPDAAALAAELGTTAEAVQGLLDDGATIDMIREALETDGAAPAAEAGEPPAAEGHRQGRSRDQFVTATPDQASVPGQDIRRGGRRRGQSVTATPNRASVPGRERPSAVDQANAAGAWFDQNVLVPTENTIRTAAEHWTDPDSATRRGVSHAAGAVSTAAEHWTDPNSPTRRGLSDAAGQLWEGAVSTAGDMAHGTIQGIGTYGGRAAAAAADAVQGLGEVTVSGAEVLAAAMQNPEEYAGHAMDGVIGAVDSVGRAVGKAFNAWTDPSSQSRQLVGTLVDEAAARVGPFVDEAAARVGPRFADSSAARQAEELAGLSAAREVERLIQTGAFGMSRAEALNMARRRHGTPNMTDQQALLALARGMYSGGLPAAQ